MNELKALFKGVLDHPRTTAAGVALIAAGLGMLKAKEYESGVLSVLTGVGFILSPDAANVKKEGTK